MASRADHVLAVDVGTSAARVSAVSLAGEVLTAARSPSHPQVAGERCVLDAHALWSDLTGLIRQVTAQAGAPVAVGVASQLGMVLADDAFDPVAPAFLWPDRRAGAEAAELDGLLGSLAVAGRRASPELTGPRLRWVVRHEPGTWARTRWVLSLKDFIVARLTGRVATDATSASYTLLFDVRDRGSSADLLAAVEVPAGRLPPVLGAHEPCGAVGREVAAATGLPAGTPVAVGGPDGSVAALGSGAVRAGLTVDVAGSTDVLLHLCERPILDPDRRSILNAFLLPGLWAVGGPTGLTGGAAAWLSGVLGYDSVEAAYRDLGPAAAGIAPGAVGVTFHTALSGERFPTWSAGRAGQVSGLRPEHTAAHLLRAAEEGAAFVVREGLEALAALGVEVGEIRVSGGVTRQPAAMQLRADVLRRRLVGVTNPEATTIGTAMLAAVCSGAHPTIDPAAAAMVRLDAPVEPDPEAADAYDGAFLRWQGARLAT
jgi:sugar (pentulose or hexulose) kinase